MDSSQILRIPNKYGELLNTMSDEEAGKLIKCLFGKNCNNLEGLTKTYYNIMSVDIDNIEFRVRSGKKGGRPKKPMVIEKEKPLVIEKPNLDKISKDNINKEIKEELDNFIIHWNNVFNEKRQVTKPMLDKYISIRKNYSKEEFKKGYNAYKDKKIKTKKEEGEFKYLLSPLAFLTNTKNGFISYL